MSRIILLLNNNHNHFLLDIWVSERRGYLFLDFRYLDFNFILDFFYEQTDDSNTFISIGIRLSVFLLMELSLISSSDYFLR